MLIHYCHCTYLSLQLHNVCNSYFQVSNFNFIKPISSAFATLVSACTLAIVYFVSVLCLYRALLSSFLAMTKT